MQFYDFKEIEEARSNSLPISSLVSYLNVVL